VPQGTSAATVVLITIAFIGLGFAFFCCTRRVRRPRDYDYQDSYRGVEMSADEVAPPPLPPKPRGGGGAFDVDEESDAGTFTGNNSSSSSSAAVGPKLKKKESFQEVSVI